MKVLMIVIFLLFSFSSNGQNEISIDSLRANKEYLEKKISLLGDSLKMINNQIQKIESKSRIEKYQKSKIVAKFKEGARLKKEPNAIAKPIYIFKKAKTATILDYHDGYFGVEYDTIYGYISELWAEKSSELDQYVLAKNENEKLQLHLANQIVDSTNKVKAMERRNRLITEYGFEIYGKIKSHQYWLGMTSDMAIESLGYPKIKNKTVGSWGVHEQWVYEKGKEIYLYFENGILASYQN